MARWTLIVLLMAFALIGFLHFTRGTAVHQVRDHTHHLPATIVVAAADGARRQSRDACAMTVQSESNSDIVAINTQLLRRMRL